MIRVGISNKSELEILLAPYTQRGLKRPYKRALEQYPTPVPLVAHIIWLATLRGDLKGATVADYGCGDGRIAVASLLAGSRRALCVEIDEDVLQYSSKFIHEYYGRIAHMLIFVLADATTIDLAGVDVVVMNPPFGVIKRNRGIDLKFLTGALGVARKVYSIHKYSEGLCLVLNRMVSLQGLEISYLEVLDLEIPMIYEEHRRKVYRVKALFTLLVRKR